MSGRVLGLHGDVLDMQLDRELVSSAPSKYMYCSIRTLSHTGVVHGLFEDDPIVFLRPRIDSINTFSHGKLKCVRVAI